jgi:hypothetical protein
MLGAQPLLAFSEAFDAVTDVDFYAKQKYVSVDTGVLTSGLTYTFDDIYSLNGKEVTVQCGGGNPHSVTINLSENDVKVIMAASIEKQIDPTIIVADIAHESKFEADVTSDKGAVGLMQILPVYAPDNINKCRNLIVSLGGDPNNLYDKTTNICTGATVIRCWINEYGNNEEPMRALLQGYRDYIQNPETGWSEKSIIVGKEFLDIKNQLDEMIADNQGDEK